MIASTDTHLATPGAVRSETIPATAARARPPRSELPDGPARRLRAQSGRARGDLGGGELARRAVRRHAPPRGVRHQRPAHVVRFFGGWELPRRPVRRSRRSSRRATPRRADGRRPAGAHARIGRASRSGPCAIPGRRQRPERALQRIQIIKGWLENGAARERVFDVAGDPENGASVDLATCTPQRPGRRQLCRSGATRDFDPGQRAFYYARVVENPTCRWSTYVCKAAGVDCSDPRRAGGARGLLRAGPPKTIQERAWTSPIWYTPAAAAQASR